MPVYEDIMAADHYRSDSKTTDHGMGRGINCGRKFENTGKTGRV
jgi:hypothetical protein